MERLRTSPCGATDNNGTLLAVGNDIQVATNRLTKAANVPHFTRSRLSPYQVSLNVFLCHEVATADAAAPSASWSVASKSAPRALDVSSSWVCSSSQRRISSPILHHAEVTRSWLARSPAKLPRPS